MKKLLQRGLVSKVAAPQPPPNSRVYKVERVDAIPLKHVPAAAPEANSEVWKVSDAQYQSHANLVKTNAEIAAEGGGS